MVQKGALKLLYGVIDDQTTGVLTKPLERIKFEYFREKVGVIHIVVPRKRE